MDWHVLVGAAFGVLLGWYAMKLLRQVRFFTMDEDEREEFHRGGGL